MTAVPTRIPASRRWPVWVRTLTPAEWLRLSGFGSAVALLHLVGWGLFVYYSRSNPALAGLGTLAYTFGLRHAFDADHIAAIDNTTRKFLHDGKRSLGVGFFFSLGHSTIVFSLVTGLAVAAKAVSSSTPSFQSWGTYVGTEDLGHVPLDHRRPEPARAARRAPHLPRDAARAPTTRSNSRSACSTVA